MLRSWRTIILRRMSPRQCVFRSTRSLISGFLVYHDISTFYTLSALLPTRFVIRDVCLLLDIPEATICRAFFVDWAVAGHGSAGDECEYFVVDAGVVGVGWKVVVLLRCGVQRFIIGEEGGIGVGYM